MIRSRLVGSLLEVEDRIHREDSRHLEAGQQRVLMRGRARPARIDAENRQQTGEHRQGQGAGGGPGHQALHAARVVEALEYCPAVVSRLQLMAVSYRDRTQASIRRGFLAVFRTRLLAAGGGTRRDFEAGAQTAGIGSRTEPHAAADSAVTGAATWLQRCRPSGALTAPRDGAGFPCQCIPLLTPQRL